MPLGGCVVEVGDVLQVGTTRRVVLDDRVVRCFPGPAAARPSYVDTFLYDAHPAMAQAVGDGALYALAPGRGFLAHREAGNRIHTYVVLDRPLEWFDGIDFADADTAKAVIAAEFEDWAPELVSLIADADSAPALRSIHQLPDRHRWERVPGVTLIGDAAHVTLPGGEGANVAMLDGAELGQAIAAHRDDSRPPSVPTRRSCSPAPRRKPSPHTRRSS